MGGALSSLSWVYLLAAGLTIYQLGQHRRELWDDRLTGRARQLAGGAAFFILLPLGVLLHEFGHMLAAWSTGSEVLGLYYFVYWGYVNILPANPGPLLDWYIAVAGNFLSYLLGIACMVLAVRGARLKPAVRVTLIYLGILELVQTLIFYPLISLDPNFYGDWDSIYSFKAPVASGATLAVHVLSLAVFVWFINRNQVALWLLGRSWAM